ncbi:MAG: hypothetical protein ACFFG0_39125 [Candidatus Thorarchaeota archaeon]
MTYHLESKLEELKLRKKVLQPKIDEINMNREKEIQDVNKKYDHMIYEINYEMQQLENCIYNELIESFVKVITFELEIKRSNSLYSVSDQFKEYRENISKVDIFPRELIEKLDKVIDGSPIEEVIYLIDDLKKKYLKS